MAHKWVRWLHNRCRLRELPDASERERKSEVAHKWTDWVHNPTKRFRAGGADRNWPTSGQTGYITLTVWEVFNALERRTKSQVAHKWADWLHNPYRLWGSPTLQSGGQNQQCPTSGRIGYITAAICGVLLRFKKGKKIRSGPQVGWLAT